MNAIWETNEHSLVSPCLVFKTIGCLDRFVRNLLISMRATSMIHVQGNERLVSLGAVELETLRLADTLP